MNGMKYTVRKNPGEAPNARQCERDRQCQDESGR